MEDTGVKAFTDFGLTRTQAKVYLAIARLRLASVSQISKLAQVRREDVYRILPKLEKVGLAKRLLGTPLKVRAIPVNEAIEILLRQEEKSLMSRLSQLKARTATFLDCYKTTPRVTVEEKTHFALISEREGLISNAFSMIEKAEKEMAMVFSKSQIMQFIYHFVDELRDVLKRKVKIRVVSEYPEQGDSLPAIIDELLSPEDAIILKYSDMIASNYLIIDSSEAMIATSANGSMTDTPFLWTDSESLIRVFQTDFENIWHNSVAWRNIETIAVPEKMTQFMEQLQPTNHLIYVYDSKEGKYDVLFNYLKSGINAGIAGVYITSDEPPNEVRKAMKQFGINAEELEDSGALQIIGYKDFYIQNGIFNLTRTIDAWKSLYNKAIERGFKGLRVTGETTCFFKHNLVSELVEYEKALHRVLDIPMVAICAYDAQVINKTTDPVNLFGELARAHSTVLFTGIDSQLGRMEFRQL